MSFDKIAALTDRNAETYGFTEAERADIMQQAEDAGFCWERSGEIAPTNYQRQLEGLKRKEASLALHASTLTEYVKVQRIPRGLRSPLMPMLLKEDMEFKTKWLALCNRHSLDLMLLTIKHLHSAIQHTKAEMEKVDLEFKSATTLVDYKRAHDELKTNVDKMKQQIMQTKLKKFERDTRDYQYDRVYTWSEERAENRRQFNRKRFTKDGTDRSMSDSDAGSSGSSIRKDIPNKPFFARGNEAETSSSEQQEATNPASRTRGKIKSTKAN